MKRFCAALCVGMVLMLFCLPAYAGYNEMRIATGDKGVAVYSASNGKKQTGILFDGYVSSLSLEEENGLYSCWLTQDMTVWVNKEKAHAGWPENYWQMTPEEENAYPCHVFLAEVAQEDASLYTSPSHKHVSATHAKGTLLRVCGEFGDDYFVEGWHGNGFVPKASVQYVAPLTRMQLYDKTYGLEGLDVHRVYTGGSPLAISGSATGYSDEEPWVVKDGQQVTVLKYLDGWAQLAGGGFIETRFLDEKGDHTICYATVKSSEKLNRLNVRWTADKESRVVMKLFSGAKVQVPCHTEDWAAVYVTGTDGSVEITGSAMMEYLVFDDETVMDGCIPVRLTNNVYRGDGSTPYGSWDGNECLPAGEKLTVIGVEGEYDMEWDQGDRFLCQTEDGKVVVIWNGDGVLEPEEGTGIHVRTNASVRMRQKPHKEATPLRTLSSGTKVEVMLRGEGWTMVRYKDQTGYVMSRYLNFP